MLNHERVWLSRSWWLANAHPATSCRLELANPKENVPANSSAEQELVASPYGQLLTELLLKIDPRGSYGSVNRAMIDVSSRCFVKPSQWQRENLAFSVIFRTWIHRKLRESWQFSSENDRSSWESRAKWQTPWFGTEIPSCNEGCNQVGRNSGNFWSGQSMGFCNLWTSAVAHWPRNWHVPLDVCWPI